MSFLKMLIAGDPPPHEAIPKALDPAWRKGPRGFNRLFDLDLDYGALEGKGGVYLLWHKGVSPAWVYAGYSDTLTAALEAARENEMFRQHDVNGGLYYSWSPILPEMRYGVVAFLREILEPLYDALPEETVPEKAENGSPIQPIPVQLPH